MNVEVGLILLSIDLKTGHYNIAVNESGKILGHTQDIVQKQPMDAAIDIAFNVTGLSEKWLKCYIRDTYYSSDHENGIVVLYSAFVPAIVGLPDQYRWIPVEEFESTDDKLNKAIQNSLIGTYT